MSFARWCQKYDKAFSNYFLQFSVCMTHKNYFNYINAVQIEVIVVAHFNKKLFFKSLNKN